MTYCLSIGLCYTLMFFQNALERISFTADIWWNQRHQEFLTIMAHQLEKDSKEVLESRSALIAFQRVRKNHNGKSLTKLIMYILDHITTKVSKWSSSLIFSWLMNHGEQVRHFTMNNILNNKMCMKEQQSCCMPEISISMCKIVE